MFFLNDFRTLSEIDSSGHPYISLPEVLIKDERNAEGYREGSFTAVSGREKKKKHAPMCLKNEAKSS